MTSALDATAALRGPRREGAAPVAREPAPTPDVPRRIRLGMPQLDGAGLSENWLFRHAGALQWEAIGQRLGVPSDELRDETGARLYPTVVAVRARYDAGLAAHRENDGLDFSVEVVPCGRACAHGRIVAANRSGGVNGPARLLTLDVLTTFAARGAGGLRTTHLAPALGRAWTPPEPSTLPEPAISRLARAARRGERVEDAFSGVALATLGPALGEVTYEPSPYADYNGAGLLYFASYVTIADTATRQILRRRAGETSVQRDWALATSPVRRDVYYYDNLPLGAALRASLRLAERDETGLVTHVRLSRADDGRPMADVIARRQDVS